MVGQALASKLVDIGHQVKMGSREAGSSKAKLFTESKGDNASEGTFADAAGFGDIVINATKGEHSLAVLDSAGKENLGDKILIDVSNPLVITDGGPSLSVALTDSLGEQIQRAYPETRVVKTLNSVTAGIMVNPGMLLGPHNMFVSGNDAEAKTKVAMLLGSMGWPPESIIDLGDITGARGQEAYLLLWIRMFQETGSADYNIAVIKR